MCAQPIWNIFFFKYSKVIKYSHLRLIWWLLYDFFSFGYMRASSSIIFWYSGNRKKTENDKLTKGAKKFSHQTIFRLFIYTCIIENDFVVVTKHDYVFRPSHCSTLENPRDPPPHDGRRWSKLSVQRYTSGVHIITYTTICMYIVRTFE